MRILPGDGVTSTALVNGQMDLRSKGDESGFRCSPVGAAMWVALRHNDGFLELAADSLAEVWETDTTKVKTAMTVWSRKMIEAGLLRLEK
ncbi:hypothetical protein [Streptomyces sp. NRRL F-2747]|uniref:hypothetical protein n=1 Tax=unclassified Streptomyces TaxID=2593676 RepID=UPI0004CA27C8|nr:hypothetical protein [Streptomyces sp. NRRL F-2747]